MIIELGPRLELLRAARDLVAALGLEDAIGLGVFQGEEARIFERLARRIAAQPQGRDHRAPVDHARSENRDQASSSNRTISGAPR